MLDNIPSQALQRAGMAWLGELTRGDKGPHSTVANAVLVLCNDHDLAGLVAYDEFSHRIVLTRAAPPPFQGAHPARGPYPRAASDTDITLIQGYIQRVFDMRISQQVAQQAVDAAAEQCRVHPVRDWLAGLRWDGKKRLATWLHVAFGVDKDPYHEAVGTKFMVAGVRRVRWPGCKFDAMPVLEGAQEIGKSTACRALFSPQWYSDEMPDMRGRDAPISMLGMWGIELSELGAIIRAEVEVVKAFLSRQVDRYREMHGRRFVDRPRQTMLIGTTNDTDYLRDATGNRRFWPIACKKAEHAWIEEVREQLWAEAAHLEALGESIWLEDDGVRKAAKQAQSDRLAEDMWAQPVMDYIREGSRPRVKIYELLIHALGLPRDKHNRSAELRVAGILRGEGWERTVVREGTKTSKAWVPAKAMDQ